MKDNFEVDLYEKWCSKTDWKEDNVKPIIENAVSTGNLNFSGQSISVKTCEILSHILQKSHNFYIVNFSDCILMPDCLRMIIKSITLNKNITELCLLGNCIKDENVSNLGNLLSKATSLKILNLRWNNIATSINSFCVFCNGLEMNDSLEFLDLRNNQINAECCTYLANALKNNTTLKCLDLRWNKIQNQGATYLLDALEENKSIQNLHLQGNLIYSEMTLAIEKSIKSQSTLGQMSMECEKKIDILLGKMKAIEETHKAEIEIITSSAEKRILELDKSITNFNNNVLQDKKIITEMEEKIFVLNTNLNVEKQKSESLEESFIEKEKVMKELLEKHQSSIEQLQKALQEKDIELIQLNSSANKKTCKDKDLIDKIEAELVNEKLKSSSLIDEINWLNNKMETTIKHKTEILEVEKDMWRKKYDELEISCNAQLQRMKTLALDKQQSLENAIMELSDKQASQILTLTERYDRLHQEKTMIEEQLSSAQNTVITLQRENTSLIGQIAEPARKVSTLLEELSNEKIITEKMKQQKLTNETTIMELGIEIDKLHSDINTLRKRESETSYKLEEEIVKLKEKNKYLQNKLDHKQRKISDIRNKEKERVKMLHSAVNKYFERLTPSPKSSENS